MLLEFAEILQSVGFMCKILTDNKAICRSYHMLGLFQSSKSRCKKYHGKDADERVLNIRQNNPLTFIQWKEVKGERSKGKY